MPRIKRSNSVQEDQASSSESSKGELADQLSAIKQTFRRLKHENTKLKEANENLEIEVQTLRASAKQSPSRGGSSVARVKTLEKELRAAKKDAGKYKGRYEKLRAAELKRERHELAEGFGPSTWEDKYTLLRRFRSLIEEIVLEDPDESGKYADCAVCFDELSKDTTVAAFPCEHIFHMDCIRQLDQHAKMEQQSRHLACPTCRKNWELSDVLEVSRTAGEQWAELTDVATGWANMDLEKDDAYTEESDKTSEPSFIENDMETPEEETGPEGSERRSDEDEDEDMHITPQTPTRSQKRRRLEELAAARSGKKRKR